MDYHNPINVGEGGGIWRNLADEGHPSSPIYNPDGSFTHSAAYTLGDFIYGKNGIDTNNRVLRNTTSFTASFLENKLHVRGDFTFRNTDEGETKLKEVFLKMKETLGDADAPGSKSSAEELKSFFEKALPDYDRNRFYVSHMKKVVDWYNALKKYASLDFVEEDGQEQPAEAAEQE